jgi:hypothetical protein
MMHWAPHGRLLYWLFVCLWFTVGYLAWTRAQDIANSEGVSALGQRFVGGFALTVGVLLAFIGLFIFR